MSIFLESPWPILMIGISLEIVLAAALWCTGQGRMLWAMLGVVGVVLLGTLLEWLVLTDREAIDDLLHDCAAAAEANDVNRVLTHISPSAADVRADARTVLERVDVQMARITALEITVDRGAKPRVATATMDVVGRGRDRQGQFAEDRYGTTAIVHLRQEGSRWLITDYSLEDVQLPGARGGRARL